MCGYSPCRNPTSTDSGASDASRRFDPKQHMCTKETRTFREKIYSTSFTTYIWKSYEVCLGMSVGNWRSQNIAVPIMSVKTRSSPSSDSLCTSTSLMDTMHLLHPKSVACQHNKQEKTLHVPRMRVAFPITSTRGPMGSEEETPATPEFLFVEQASVEPEWLLLVVQMHDMIRADA